MQIDLKNTEKPLLNIPDDYTEVKYNSEDTRKALLNILEDYGTEKSRMKNTNSAVLNILEDYGTEKNKMKNTQKALLNILEDYGTEKTKMKNTNTAVINILEDYGTEKNKMKHTQRAVLNILEDYGVEKTKSESANKDLQVANKELEQFAYVASHDLQEPLRTISIFVGLLEEKYSEKIDEDTKQYLKFIVNATSKMQNLIKDLLDFSQIGRNISFAATDCNNILKEVIANIGATIKVSNAKITSTVLPVVIGNEIELRQLFQNLISNAIKFHKKNSNPEIEITFVEKETEYLFAFKDNGIGLEEQYKDRIFIIFQRLHSSTEYAGTGIGLATCKKIVALHNGKIWMESKLGHGSIFYFTIPKDKSN